MSAVPNSTQTSLRPGPPAPSSLSDLASLLSRQESRSAFQTSPEAIAACITELGPRFYSAVGACTAIQAHMDPKRIEEICSRVLPDLLRSSAAGEPDPIATIVLQLTEACVSDSREAERRFRSIIKQRAETQVAPEIEEYLSSELAPDVAEDADLEPAPVESEVEQTGDADFSQLQSRQNRDLLELSHELRLEEYNQETLRVLFDDLDPTQRLIAELHYLHSFDYHDIAAVTFRSPAVVQKTILSLRNFWLDQHCSTQLTSPGNEVRREIDREDLKLNETHGITLLSYLLKTYPNLRLSADLLNLVCDSHEFFSDLLKSKRPEVAAFRAQIIPHSGIDLPMLGDATKMLLKEIVTIRYPHPEQVRFETTVAVFLGVRSHTTGQGEFAELDARFLAACIKAGFYSGKVHAESNLIVEYRGSQGARHVRNPLTRDDVVAPALATQNAHTLLRRSFPNLDSIKVGTPGFLVAKSILGLPQNAVVCDVRKAFVTQGVLSGRLAPDYDPPHALSAYFDERCVEGLVEQNRDDMLRRRWANIDDPENDTFMAAVLGVPDTVEDLTKRALRTLGPDIPDKHPFKYNERLDSRYFDVTFVGPEKREANLRKALQDTFGSLKGFTYEAAVEEAGLPRLARLLGLKKQGFRFIRDEIERLGYLS